LFRTNVAKIIELVGSSEKGWTEAAQTALDEVKKTIKGITGLEIKDITTSVILVPAQSRNTKFLLK